MIEVRQTDEFRAWLSALRDRKAAAKIAARLLRVEFGNSGTSSRWAKASPSCASIMALATECIWRSAER
jgi:hypothetical protein